MYHMLAPVPCRLLQQAFTNGVGSPNIISEGVIVGVSTTAPTIEFIVEVGGCRFYDVPLRFLGQLGSDRRQYTPTPLGEEPEITLEAVPREVCWHSGFGGSVMRGTCYLAMTWDRANLTLLLTVLEDGRVVLWPPHKLCWDVAASNSLPAWRKRRYESDDFELPETQADTTTQEEMALAHTYAKEALQDEVGWRSHGIGLIQKYVRGPDGPRVHVWTPAAVQIGLEGGIHNHRYNLKSTIVCGRLRHEEWVGTQTEKGMWVEWLHDNHSMVPVNTGRRWNLSPRTIVFHAGTTYQFKRTGWHRTLPLSPVVITVVERFGVQGSSAAMVPWGMEPTNGQRIQQDVRDILTLARKHLSV